MSIVTTRHDDGVVEVVLDDGAMNLLRPDVLDALAAALADAREAEALVVAGRTGVLTAGLDLAWMAGADDAGIVGLLTRLGGTLLDLWTHPAPTVCAATGHAVASGTLIALACDHAIAGEGGMWGLVETRIGLEMPEVGVELARAGLAPGVVATVLLDGPRMDAARAVELGLAHELVPAGHVRARALEHARHLAGTDRAAHAGTKRRLRAALAERLRPRIEDDVRAIVAAWRARAAAAGTPSGPASGPASGSAG